MLFPDDLHDPVVGFLRDIAVAIDDPADGAAGDAGQPGNIIAADPFHIVVSTPFHGSRVIIIHKNYQIVKQV